MPRKLFVGTVLQSKRITADISNPTYSFVIAMVCCCLVTLCKKMQQHLQIILHVVATQKVQNGNLELFISFKRNSLILYPTE